MMMLEEHTATVRVPCIHALSDAQRAIVDVLHDAESAAISEIGTQLAVTPSAVRLQLVHLGEAGLVAATTENSGTRGRPRLRYRLTPAARSLFFQQANEDESAFTRAVLREVQRRDPKLIADVVNDIVGTGRPAATRGGHGSGPGTRVAVASAS